MIIHIILATFSTVFYATYLLVVVRQRNEEPFLNSYFQLTVPLGIADLISLGVDYALFKFPNWGYFQSFYTANGGQTLLLKCLFCVGAYALTTQYSGLFLMAFNRCTAIYRPLLYKFHWSSWLKKAIIIQLFVSLLLTMTRVLDCPDIKYVYTVCKELPMNCENDIDFKSRIKGGVPLEVGSDMYEFTNINANESVVLNANKITLVFGSPGWLYNAGDKVRIPFLLGVFTAVTILNVMNVVGLIRHNRKKRKVIPSTAAAKNNDQANQGLSKAEINLSVASLFIFMVMIMFVSAAVYLAAVGLANDPYKNPLASFLTDLAVDAFAYMNPYITLACSKGARDKFLAFIKVKQ